MTSLFDDDLPVVRVALPVPLRRCFDYVLPPVLQRHYLPVGARVLVPYRQQTLVGVVWQRNVVPEIAPEKLKMVQELLDDVPLLDEHQIALANWVARYYHAPIGEVLTLMLPTLLRQGGAAHLQEEVCWQLTSSGQQIDPAQIKNATKQAALVKVLQKHRQPVPASVLRALDFTLAHMTALADKGLAQKVLQPKRGAAKVDLLARGSSEPVLAEVGLALNSEQQQAVDAVKACLDQHQTFLLEGVTGSGKTEVYLQIIAEVLKHKRQVLVLVPEIGLAPQTVDRFKHRFTVPVLTLHSSLNEKERLDAWLLSQSGKAGILIGTRSAVLTPFYDLGLIVIDEEHDASYKQGDGIRYSARDLALVRGNMLNIPVVLGSATPALETLHNAKTQRYKWLKLNQRAGKAVTLPEIYLHNVQHKKLRQGFDLGLLPVMREHLESGGQVLVFINRRGFAPTLMCHECGWMAECQSCDARMTLHREPPKLHCHHCDAVQVIPRQCPKCFHPELSPMGAGTERTEEALEQALADWPVYRVDRDSTSRKGAMEKLLIAVRTGQPCVLVGTQMLAKGHHFPAVSLVVILDADGGFYSSDFRGLERMGQLLTQVAGRAGREQRRGKVVVQTLHPEDPLLNLLAAHQYPEFSAQLLMQREEGLLPPFSFMALLRAEAPKTEDVSAFLNAAVERVSALCAGLPEVEVIGPMPAPMERRFGRYHMQLWIQSTRRAALHQVLEQLVWHIEQDKLSRKVRWSLDVDPQEML